MILLQGNSPDRLALLPTEAPGLHVTVLTGEKATHKMSRSFDHSYRQLCARGLVKGQGSCYWITQVGIEALEMWRLSRALPKVVERPKVARVVRAPTQWWGAAL